MSPAVAAQAGRVLELASKNLRENPAPTGVSEYEEAVSKLSVMLSNKEIEAARGQEGESMMAKVIVIADDYRNREPFAKIAQVFFEPIQRKESRVISYEDYEAPEVSAPFCDENFRIPWEFFALGGFDNRSSTLAGWRPFEALIRIADERSIILLQYIYGGILTSDARPGFKAQELDFIRGTLLKIGSPEALRAFLGCLKISRANENYFLKSAAYEESADDVFLSQARRDSQRLARLKDTIREFDQKDLSESERRFLRQILDPK